ncbi:MAG: methyltransferase protein [Frankiales bacterium]|nr:methyltransferase protein [Frankiales bacterium]
MTSALEVYGQDLLTTTTGRSTSTWLCADDGTRHLLDLPRWIAPADRADHLLLDRCTGPSLDVGCGPGRLTRSLVARGTACLGVDVAPVAVSLARVGGTPVLHASVFDAVLDGPRWGSVLLADGNIGIGGDAVALLTRCRSLLRPLGRVLVELEGPGVPSRTVQVRLESSSGLTSGWFPWAHVSVDEILPIASSAGLLVAEQWHTSGRWFVDLRSAA